MKLVVDNPSHWVTGVDQTSDNPHISDCLAHRCLPHREVPIQNRTESTGAECGGCIAIERDEARAGLTHLKAAIGDLHDLRQRTAEIAHGEQCAAQRRGHFEKPPCTCGLQYLAEWLDRLDAVLGGKP